jgi:DNA-binding transcriptional LysR family regulator
MPGRLPNVDPDGLLEYSVVYTDRAQPHVQALSGRDAGHLRHPQRGVPRQVELTPQAMAGLPLLQQSTRQALAGARFELFSMTAAAAVQGLGLALMPPLLVQEELARGDLRVACAFELRSQRAYYLVRPEADDNAAATQLFEDWLVGVVTAQHAMP